MALQKQQINDQATDRSILTELLRLRDSEEEAARHLFIVCGQPAAYGDFIDAWHNEDPIWFCQWESLCALIKSLQLAQIQAA